MYNLPLYIYDKVPSRINGLLNGRIEHLYRGITYSYYKNDKKEGLEEKIRNHHVTISQFLNNKKNDYEIIYNKKDISFINYYDNGKMIYSLEFYPVHRPNLYRIMCCKTYNKVQKTLLYYKNGDLKLYNGIYNKKILTMKHEIKSSLQYFYITSFFPFGDININANIPLEVIENAKKYYKSCYNVNPIDLSCRWYSGYSRYI